MIENKKPEQKIIGVQMPISLVNQLKALAGDNAVSISDVIRMIILDYFKNHSNKETRDKVSNIIGE